MPLMGCLSSDFHGLQQLVLSIQAVSYLTPNWRFSSIADKPVLVCDNRCIARNHLVSGSLVFAKIVFPVNDIIW